LSIGFENRPTSGVFANLVRQWPEIKKQELKLESFRPLKRYADCAMGA
jgi:hypothetical protein